MLKVFMLSNIEKAPLNAAWH